MMRWLVFEAGSRAGLSAEMFFRQYAALTGSDDVLVMVDADSAVNSVCAKKQIERVTEKVALEMLGNDDVAIFPADELTRQRDKKIVDTTKFQQFSFVEPWFYDKRLVNLYLHKSTFGKTAIRIPETFMTDKLCLRPNSMSAGSRGVELLEAYCVTRKIDIAKEFVVDVFRKSDKEMLVFPREVMLKNGYDRLVKLLSPHGALAYNVMEFVETAFEQNNSLFSGVFHLQLVEDTKGRLWYIESSKRISGTSLVNAFRGFNPFCMMQDMNLRVEETLFAEDKWYRYEDFLLKWHEMNLL